MFFTVLSVVVHETRVPSKVSLYHAVMNRGFSSALYGHARYLFEMCYLTICRKSRFR